ncbi:MAG: hypothetical protein JST47_11260 [Bacteroidetes bacterium]|nr:hypothetical protein [Bacteroidota bacterium]MBS1974258.1 hypothetical protein [Bacteroidota bacterium]
MKRKLFILFFILAASAGLAFISYTHKKTARSQECGSEKCEQKKAQTDFIILESLSKYLLPATEN